MSVPSVTAGRLCIAAAAILWSLGGAFNKVLTKPTELGLDVPGIDTWPIAAYELPIQIAFYRALFAGLVLMPTLRRGDIQFRPMMLAMALAFAVMNATYVAAQSLGTAANAILLQNSASLWMYLASIFWLGETPSRRGTISLFLGLAGIGIIVGGGWKEGGLGVVGIALVSGGAYAGILLGLRVLRDLPANWLTVWNHLIGALVLLPLVVMLRPPTWQQYIVLILFGAIQLGFPYWLMARGLRSVDATEAGAIVLLEPILNPLWTWMVCDEVPSGWTYVGGAVIIAALAYRYWPQKPQAPG